MLRFIFPHQPGDEKQQLATWYGICALIVTVLLEKPRWRRNSSKTAWQCFRRLWRGRRCRFPLWVLPRMYLVYEYLVYRLTGIIPGLGIIYPGIDVVPLYMCT